MVTGGIRSRVCLLHRVKALGSLSGGKGILHKGGEVIHFPKKSKINLLVNQLVRQIGFRFTVCEFSVNVVFENC